MADFTFSNSPNPQTDPLRKILLLCMFYIEDTEAQSRYVMFGVESCLPEFLC